MFNINRPYVTYLCHNCMNVVHYEYIASANMTPVLRETMPWLV